MLNLTRRGFSYSHKVLKSAHEAVKNVKSGDKLLFGGFGLVGIPENLIAALADGLTVNHTVMSNEGGTDYFGLG
jgi:acyl CoA:acetate/3-ketoacid CoA transferase alpha subunit